MKHFCSRTQVTLHQKYWQQSLTKIDTDNFFQNGAISMKKYNVRIIVYPERSSIVVQAILRIAEEYANVIANCYNFVVNMPTECHAVQILPSIVMHFEAPHRYAVFAFAFCFRRSNNATNVCYERQFFSKIAKIT